MRCKKPSRPRHSTADSDLLKGAVEPDRPGQHGNNSLAGQLGHRTEDDMIKGSDSDFPEPGENPEHSGEPQEKKNPEGVMQDQQADQREDPLAS